jgi:hypothetical protein
LVTTAIYDEKERLVKRSNEETETLYQYDDEKNQFLIIRDGNIVTTGDLDPDTKKVIRLQNENISTEYQLDSRGLEIKKVIFHKNLANKEVG